MLKRGPNALYDLWSWVWSEAVHLALSTSDDLFTHLVFFFFSSLSDEECWDADSLFPSSLVEENLERLRKHRRTVLTIEDDTDHEADVEASVDGGVSVKRSLIFLQLLLLSFIYCILLYCAVCLLFTSLMICRGMPNQHMMCFEHELLYVFFRDIF